MNRLWFRNINDNRLERKKTPLTRQISVNSNPDIIEGQPDIINQLVFDDYTVNEPFSKLETLKLLNELYINLMKGIKEPMDNINYYDNVGAASLAGTFGNQVIPVFGLFKNSLDNFFSSQKDQNLYFIQASCKSLGDIDEIDTKKQEKFDKYERFLNIVEKNRSRIFADTEFSEESKFSESFRQISEKLTPKSDKEKLEDTLEIILGILENIFIKTVKIEIQNNSRIVESIENPKEEAETIIRNIFTKIDDKTDVIIKFLKNSCNNRSKDIKKRKKRLKSKKRSITQEEKEKKEISGILDPVVRGKTDLFGNPFEGGRKIKSLRGKNRKTIRKHKRKNSTKKKK